MKPKNNSDYAVSIVVIIVLGLVMGLIIGLYNLITHFSFLSESILLAEKRQGVTQSLI
jgi:hypothetical protein